MANSSPSSSKPLVNQVDWYAIASKIRIQNEKLKTKIAQLETIIQEQKQQIKVQVIKNQESSSLAENQQEKIQELQNKIAEKTEQINNQQTTINHLTKELEKIQQQMASLERECSLLQDNYNEQQNQLKQLEKENKELKTRLQRQQRYNIQYKTALAQVINASSGENHGNSTIKSFDENNLPPSFSTPKNQINSPQPEKIIDDNQPLKDTNQNNELPENIGENQSLSQEIIDINNSLDSSTNNLDSSNNFLKKSEIIDSKIKQQTSSTADNQAQQEIKPKRRMFIQLPPIWEKKER